jgi:pilus assembly protein CpaC
LLILLLALFHGPTVVWAQAPVLSASAVVTSPTATEPNSVRLLVGRSTVLDVGTPVSRVSLTSADVADALVTSPTQLLIHGKMPGTISLFVWDRAGALRRYEVDVQRDIDALTQQVHELFPGEQISVKGNGKNVVLSGIASSKDVIDRATNLATSYVDKKEEVITLVQLGPSAASNQVLLRVRFAEVSRSAMTELGASFFTSPTGVKNTIGRVTTEQFPSVGFDNLTYTKANSGFGSDVTSASGQFAFSDFLNLFLFSEKYDLGTMVRALQTRGLFQSLAEPNLVAESGKEASFLAGGEIPIPVAQATTGGTTISVQYKEFGIRLNFTPVVSGDRVRLRVRPEVSTLDFTNAVVLNGFRIPALSTRRTETELELSNGQTFAIAGLLNNSATSSLQKVPGIGSIPILGLLFQSKAAQKDQTELVVMITPQILALNSNGVTPNLPRTPEPYLPPLTDKKTFPTPPPAFGGPRPVGTVNATAAPAVIPVGPVASPSATGAAAVTALTPGAARPMPTVNDSQTVPANVQGSSPERPLTEQETKALERARRQDEERAREQAKADEHAKVEAAKRRGAQAAIDQKKAAEEKERKEKAAKEQAKRDAESARKHAELDREHQKSVDEAAARLKAAQQAYDAELAKKDKQ